MTAVAPVAGREERGTARPGSVPWRRLAWAAWRQHRTALAWTLAVVGLAAAWIALTGVHAHELAAGRGPYWSAPGDVVQRIQFPTVLAWQLLPALAGVFLGAPLLAREAEHRTGWLACTQSASRTRWLLATVIPGAALLALAGAALGAEFGWWLAPWTRGPSVSSESPWRPLYFDLHLVPFVGWTLLAFSLGVLLGALIRQVVGAMAATLAGYGALLYVVSNYLRMHYQSPIRQGAGAVTAHTVPFDVPGLMTSPGSNIVSSYLGFPDGRALSSAQVNQSLTWLSQHHVVVWATYQPASRYFLFQWIELGWLAALSALLVAATIVLIRRRS
jgi:hypothetical protein